MDIIICPIFINNLDISSELSIVYIENNNTGLSLNNFYAQISNYKINNIYILLNSCAVNIFNNINLPPLSSNKINLALNNILAEDLLDNDNIYTYDKKSKQTVAVNFQLINKIITYFNNFKANNIYILPLAKFLLPNTGIIQNYFSPLLSFNINTYTFNVEKTNNYGLTLFENNHNLVTHLYPNIIFSNLPLNHIWLELKNNFKDYFNLNLNQHKKSQAIFSNYIKNPIFYITLAILVLHVTILQSIILWQNYQLKQKNQQIKQVFHKALPNQPMLDPILQLQKLQVGQKQDIALTKLDEISVILHKNINNIATIKYIDNIWQVKFIDKDDKQQISQNIENLKQDLQKINFTLNKKQDIWQIIKN